MTGEQMQILGIVLCVMGCMVLAITQPLLSIWHRKQISGA